MANTSIDPRVAAFLATAKASKVEEKPQTDGEKKERNSFSKSVSTLLDEMEEAKRVTRREIRSREASIRKLRMLYEDVSANEDAANLLSTLESEIAQLQEEHNNLVDSKQNEVYSFFVDYHQLKV